MIFLICKIYGFPFSEFSFVKIIFQKRYDFASALINKAAKMARYLEKAANQIPTHAMQLERLEAKLKPLLQEKRRRDNSVVKSNFFVFHNIPQSNKSIKI